MSTINVNFTLPTKRSDGTALPASEIAYVDVQQNFNGGAYASIGHSVGGAPISEANVPAGIYGFKLTVYDTQTPPQVSTVVAGTVTVPAPTLAAPGPVTNLNITIT